MIFLTISLYYPMFSVTKKEKQAQRLGYLAENMYL